MRKNPSEYFIQYPLIYEFFHFGWWERNYFWPCVISKGFPFDSFQAVLSLALNGFLTSTHWSLFFWRFKKDPLQSSRALCLAGAQYSITSRELGLPGPLAPPPWPRETSRLYLGFPSQYSVLEVSWGSHTWLVFCLFVITILHYLASMSWKLLFHIPSVLAVSGWG